MRRKSYTVGHLSIVHNYYLRGKLEFVLIRINFNEGLLFTLLFTYSRSVCTHLQPSRANLQMYNYPQITNVHKRNTNLHNKY